MDELNVSKINFVSARNTGNVLNVFTTLLQCEAIELTPDQIAMGRDILATVNENGLYKSSWYLIQYGMLLARNEKAALDAANTQDGTVEQKSEHTSVSTSNDNGN